MKTEFIDGITVLSESTFVMEWWKALGLAILAALVIGCLFAGLEKDWSNGLLYGIIVLVLVFCILYIPNREPETTYKVLIDESVSLKDFDELYEITGHEGEMVLIKIKEQKE